MNIYQILYFISIPVTYYTIRWISFSMDKFLGNEDVNWGWDEVKITFGLSFFSLASILVFSFMALKDILKIKVKFPEHPPKWL